MKLWDKNIPTDKLIEKFTVGCDRELDSQLALHDIVGSLAHVQMLAKVGLLGKPEAEELAAELKKIYRGTEKNGLEVEEGMEDIHSQVEKILTERMGQIGKKIHSGRSRNHQVLLDLKLFTRDQIKTIAQKTAALFEKLLHMSEKHKDVLMPGYTHLQAAMPSSFGLWFGAYAESLADDMISLQAAYRLADQNPLGSGAGYGSSFPLDREMTTKLLGFSEMSHNVVYAQMGRGRTEKAVAVALAAIAQTLNKMAADVCMYVSQNFGFMKLPDVFTTGSSIMPHKKNPDVFELIRARCMRLQNLPNEISLIMANLTSGYFRDLQLIKEGFMPAFAEMEMCLEMLCHVVPRIEVNADILADAHYDLIFSVEAVHAEVQKGLPFRDAYKKVAADIAKGQFKPVKAINHSLHGSIGNPATKEIREKMARNIAAFQFERAEKAIAALLADK